MTKNLRKMIYCSNAKKADCEHLDGFTCSLGIANKDIGGYGFHKVIIVIDHDGCKAARQNKENEKRAPKR